ncbi:MAG TPA: hypothetical protein VNI77_11410 [Nitrososphaera sp.]|nr:hypothetical protein [Nitrososphaera sp.]
MTNFACLSLDLSGTRWRYTATSSAFNAELINGEVKSRRVMTLSNLTYGELVRYLNELEGKKLIKQNPLQLTERDDDFCRITIELWTL